MPFVDDNTPKSDKKLMELAYSARWHQNMRINIILSNATT